METKSLWPKIEVEKRRLPFNILKEQATLLNSVTSGYLTGEIVSSNTKYVTSLDAIKRTSSNDYRVYKLYIRANMLADYRYLLLTLVHNTLEIYPTYIKSEIGKTDMIVYNEEELLNILSNIFGHSDTKEIIETLVLQSVEDISL